MHVRNESLPLFLDNRGEFMSKTYFKRVWKLCAKNEEYIVCINEFF